MRCLKIAHLAIDEKFIDQAMKTFESEAPGANDLYIITNRPLRLVKSKAETFTRLEAIGGKPLKKLAQYDVIIIHSLHPAWFSTIKSLSGKKTLVWLGWGQDYYDIIASSKAELILPLTQSALTRTSKPGIAHKAKQAILKLIDPKKSSIIERIDLFAPVLPSEYDLVKEKSPFKNFPQKAIWNYGNLEEDFPAGSSDIKAEGDTILIGNSATPENNHIDAFSSLFKAGIKERRILSPLSYGIPEYRQMVISEGRKYFGNSFTPLIDFMPISDYINSLRSCGFVIMNHVRQQAVGNIVIMLHLGAKVFLREECPTFVFFKSQGAVIYSMQDLEKTPSLIEARLDTESMATNKRIVETYWSKEASRSKTRKLLMQVCIMRNENYSIA